MKKKIPFIISILASLISTNDFISPTKMYFNAE